MAKSMLAGLGQVQAVHTTSHHRHEASGWRCERRRMGGGILIDFGVHHIRAIRHLMGEPQSVYATTAPQLLPQMEGEDNVSLSLSGEGWRGTVWLGWAGSVGDHPEYIIVAKGGTLKLQPDAKFIDFYPVGGTKRSRLLSRFPYRIQERLRTPEIGRRRIRVSGDRLGYRETLGAFLRLAESGEKSSASAVEARRDLEIVLRAYDSIRTGMPVPISPSQHPAYETPLAATA
jgi:predicted dehydrogenase